MSDLELVTEFLNGDEAAFHSLVAKYQRQLYYTVKAVVLDSEDAKDITQEAFIRAFNNVKKLKKRSSFKSWLFQIAMNLARDHFKKQKENLELAPWLVDEKTKVEDEVSSKDLALKIKKILSTMAPRQRMILSLHLFKEMKPKEIASLLNMKQETVRTNLYFGLKNLRQQIRKEGVI